MAMDGVGGYEGKRDWLAGLLVAWLVDTRRGSLVIAESGEQVAEIRLWCCRNTLVGCIIGVKE